LQLTSQVGPLEIGIKVDLHDTIADGLTEVIDRGAGATVEDKENGLVFLCANPAKTGLDNVLREKG
jgi:hypothetical protein